MSTLDAIRAKYALSFTLAELAGVRASIAWWRDILHDAHATQAIRDRAAFEMHSAYREAFALLKLAKERRAIMEAR